MVCNCLNISTIRQKDSLPLYRFILFSGDKWPPATYLRIWPRALRPFGCGGTGTRRSESFWTSGFCTFPRWGTGCWICRCTFRRLHRSHTSPTLTFRWPYCPSGRDFRSFRPLAWWVSDNCRWRCACRHWKAHRTSWPLRFCSRQWCSPPDCHIQSAFLRPAACKIPSLRLPPCRCSSTSTYWISVLSFCWFLSVMWHRLSWKTSPSASEPSSRTQMRRLW